MKALILNGKVAQVEDKEFPVHPSLIWLDCPDECKAGWTYDGSDFIAPPPVVEQPIIVSERDKKLDALWDAVAMKDTKKLDEIKGRLL